MYLTLHLKLTQPGSMLAFPGAPFQGGTRDKAPSVHSLPMETGPLGWGSELEEAKGGIQVIIILFKLVLYLINLHVQ